MATARISYPFTRTCDVVEELHGVKVADPYRWLEDPDAPETKAWVDSQNEVTNKYLGTFHDVRTASRARLESLQNYGRTSCPMRRGEHVYVFRNTGLQNQDVMYRLPLASIAGDSAGADAGEVFMDLNAQFPAGTTALGSSAFSEDGRWFAYGLAHAGSDWQTLHVRDVSTGVDTADVIPWTKFTRIAWTHDNAGFFYTRHPEPGAVDAGTETSATEYAMVMYHALGTPASEDILVFADPSQPIWRYGAEVSDDGQYLLLITYKSTDPVNKLYYAHLPSVWPEWREHAAAHRPALPPGGTPPASDAYRYMPFHRVVDTFDAEFDYLSNDGARFYFKTNAGAPKYKVVATDLPAQGVDKVTFADVISESADVLDWATVANTSRLLLCYLRDCVNVVLTAHLPASPPPLDAVLIHERTDIPLPAPGTIASFSGRREHASAFVKFVSFTTPGTILKLDLTPPAQPRITTFYETPFAGVDASAFEVRQEFVPSKDGAVRIPLFIVRKKDVPAGPQPTLMYGYGGFNISLQPSFSAMRMMWLTNFNAVYALACIRGGGEYGESWHAAGSKHAKQNCFDDFMACAEHLVATGVTAPRRIGIMGGSNGGLLTLACALQRPELLGAAVSQVPVADMLRFHKFTVGALWRGEYGFAEDDKSDFEYMMTYSPLHNVRRVTSPEAQLPSILITTADHDDRVVPLHSLKMAATLQAEAGVCEEQTRPLLVRVETNAGHGAGKPTTKVLDEYADVYSFLAHELGATWRDV